jgi:ABC-type lipoprotein release transport system permease subunit
MREIGIRIALGATARSVLVFVLRRTMRPVVVRAVIGVVAAAGVARVLSSVLFGVSPIDPLALLGAALAVASVALVAGVVPARRAARVDPDEDAVLRLTHHCRRSLGRDIEGRTVDWRNVAKGSIHAGHLRHR